MEKVAEVQLTYKTKVKPSERAKIQSSVSAVDILRPFYGDDIEYIEKMYVIYLNRANKVLGVNLLSTGGTSGTYCDPKLIFQGAILANASAIILSHNHPSGALKPSEADIQLTKKVKQGCGLFDMALLDHVIVTPEHYYSFADEGII
jgi:DNA repair protein RadC